MKLFKANANVANLLTLAQEECKLAQKLSGNANIIAVHSFQEKQPITIDGIEQVRDYLILEYCEQGDLFSYFCSYGDR